MHIFTFKNKIQVIVETSIPEGNQTYIEHQGHFLLNANLFNGTTEMPKDIARTIRPL